MSFDVNKFLEESRERELIIQDQIDEEKREALRHRSYHEAVRLIDSFKIEHKRKKKSVISINILSTFLTSIEKFNHELRFFINGQIQSKYILHDEAFHFLSKNIKPSEYSHGDIYNIFRSDEQ